MKNLVKFVARGLRRDGEPDFHAKLAVELTPLPAHGGPPPAEALATLHVVPPKLDGPRLDLADRCYQAGYKAARDSGLTEPAEATRKALEMYAMSVAISIHHQTLEDADRSKLAQIITLETTLRRRVLYRDAATARLMACRRKLGALGPRGPIPAVSAVFRHGMTAWLALAAVPTLHDWFPGLDPFLKWAAGGGCALGISAVLVHGILPDASTLQRREGTFAAGLMFGGALFLMRVAASPTLFPDVVVAGALTLIEGSGVWLLENAARQLGPDIAAWKAHDSALRRAEGEAASAQNDLVDRQKTVDDTEAEIANLDNKLERNHALSDAKALSSISVNASNAGYAVGIADNAAGITEARA